MSGNGIIHTSKKEYFQSQRCTCRKLAGIMTVEIYAVHFLGISLLHQHHLKDR